MSWYIIAGCRDLSFTDFMKAFKEAKSKAVIASKGQGIF